MRVPYQLYVLLLASSWFLSVALSQEDLDYPYYAEQDLPETSFTCTDKIHGAYYADIETGCQMYHICARDDNGRMRSNKFMCGNGTVFDQRKLVCQDYRKVPRCSQSPRYYKKVSDKVLEIRMRAEEKDRAISYEEYLDYPTYSEHDLPQTRFTCTDKVQGAFYADVETACQMYHICVRDENGRMRSNKFLCGNGTVFDQRKLVCQTYGKVRCADSPNYYRNIAPRVAELRMKAMERDREIPHEDYPIYSADNLPRTSFTCKDKVQGGYYADVETDCQMYHVCSRDKFGKMRSTRFLCGNGTVFDQRHLICQDYRKVIRCHESPSHYRNVATLLELLEARLRTEKRDKEIIKASRFEFPRYK